MLLIHNTYKNALPTERVDRAQDVNHVRTSVLRIMKREKTHNGNTLSIGSVAQVQMSYQKGYLIEMDSATPNLGRADWRLRGAQVCFRRGKRLKLILKLVNLVFPGVSEIG